MSWVVTGYRNRKAQYGEGSKAQTIERKFEDKPTALRFAQNLVEAGPCSFASVQEVK